MVPQSLDNAVPLPLAAQPLTIGGTAIPSRFFLAPLAGYTSLAFRLAVRELGGLGLATTDLVNARSLLERRPKSFELAATCPADQPVSIQLYGHEPDEMSRAAQWVEAAGASLVDVNMGCPVRKVVRSGGGSALLCETDSARRLVETLVGAVAIPVTVKMRLGWDDDNLSAPLLAKLFEDVGAAAVIVHGRTRAQGFHGAVNQGGIKEVVEAVRGMPIVGNGDVRTIADADAMFRTTGCAAISIGRGALANPFFFRELDHWARTGEILPPATFEERVNLLERHFHGLADQKGERIACLQFRKLIKWYYHLTHMPKDIYSRLINLASSAILDTALEELRERGPARPLDAQAAAPISVPTGPIDLW